MKGVMPNPGSCSQTADFKITVLQRYCIDFDNFTCFEKLRVRIFYCFTSQKIHVEFETTPDRFLSRLKSTVLHRYFMNFDDFTCFVNVKVRIFGFSHFPYMDSETTPLVMTYNYSTIYSELKMDYETTQLVESEPIWSCSLLDLLDWFCSIESYF